MQAAILLEKLARYRPQYRGIHYLALRLSKTTVGYFRLY